MLKPSKCIKWFITGTCWLILFCCIPVFAQTSKVNQLQLKLKTNLPDTERLKLLKQLTEAYTPVDPVKKYYYANLFKALAIKLHNNEALADAYIQIGISYGVRSMLDSALICFQLAYAQSEKINYQLGMGKSLSDIGFVYDRLDEKKEAIKNDFRALAILKKTNNQRLVNQLYTNIGSIYFDLKKYKLAQSYFNQCLISFTASKDTAGIGYALFTMGNCAQALMENAKAMDYFTRSLTIREKLGDLNGIALVKRGIGTVYFHQKQYDKALTYLDSALTSIRKIKDRYEECATLLDLTDVYLDMKLYNKAEDCAKQCLNISKAIKSKTGVSHALERLTAIYKSKGNIKQAFKYQSDYIATEQDIADEKALKDVTLVEFKRMQAENAELEKDNKIIASANNSYLARIKKYNSVIFVTIIGLIFVIIIVIVLYRQNIEKNATNEQLIKQKEEIANINNELALLNEEINAQVELTITQNAELERVNGIKNKFFSIISHDLRSPISSLQSLLSIYRQGGIDEDELAFLLATLEDTIITTGTFLDNLLEWSKSQMEGIVIKAQNFDISACIEENIRLFETKIVMKKLEVVNLTANPVMAYADKDMISLVVRNILSNSIKFCDVHDKITLEAKLKDNHVVITISDTGPGISEAEQKRLFNLEHTLSHGTHGEKGNHLGLILCRDMIIQNNGKIWYETEEGVGTTFYVELPAGNQTSTTFN